MYLNKYWNKCEEFATSKVHMALEFLQQWQAMWNHPFITRITPLIMWLTLYINTGSWLRCVQVVKMACLIAILIYKLTIFWWRLVSRGCLCSMEPQIKAALEGFEGISAEMTASILAAVMQSLQYLRRMWACGRPRFWNSMEWIQYNSPSMWGNIVFNACSSSAIFLLNTHMMTTGMSVKSCPWCSWDWISGQFVLHVIVIKKVGGPYIAATASKSDIYSVAQWRDPRNDAGR